MQNACDASEVSKKRKSKIDKKEQKEMKTTSDQFNLVWWCIIMSQSVVWKYCFAIFKV